MQSTRLHVKYALNDGLTMKEATSGPRKLIGDKLRSCKVCRTRTMEEVGDKVLSGDYIGVVVVYFHSIYSNRSAMKEMHFLRQEPAEQDSLKLLINCTKSAD